MGAPRPLLFACSLAALLASAAPAWAQGSLTPRTLKRTVDTVVLDGSACGKAKGAKISQIRLYTCRGGYMTPITYQIDEVDPSGIFCWNRGEKDRRRRDNDRGGFDANDQLVFLARDIGDRALPHQLAMVPGAIGFQEIEITDPISKGKGWVYIFLFQRTFIPGRPSLDLTSLKVRKHADDSRTHYWYGESFLFHNDKSRKNAVRATYAGLAAPGTRDYRGVPNIVDSTQVKAVVSFMWVTLTRQSDDIRVNIGGYIDGPLRVVAENMLKVHLALGFWVSAPNSYLILWRNKMSMPTNADNPVNLDESDDSSYTLCVDMNKNAKGLYFYNSHNKTPVAIDGKMSAAEQQLNTTYPDYNVVYGAQGGLISKFVIPPFLAKRKRSKLVYLDDATHERNEESAEFQKGAFGYNGYVMDMRGLKKGTYPGDYVVWYAPPGFKPGDEIQYVNEYDHPLVGKATAVQR
ncbi:MAG TPA: hypothetical protein DEA08_02790 [Planctomycetes bacterium]|nr:hypothetical protein [Planctomycetota bacterium]